MDMLFTYVSIPSLKLDWYSIQVVAGGNIVLGSQLFMNAHQKTFSLAASRAMVPEARIVVWAILNSGEVIADSLSFHVDGIRTEEVVYLP